MIAAPLTRQAATLMLLAALGWPLIEAVGGSLMMRHGPYHVVVLRYSAHLAILVPLGLLHAGADLFRTRRPVLQLLRGFMMFLMPVAFVSGTATSGAPWVWTAFWCLVGLILLGARLLGERPVWLAWAVAGSALLGSWLTRGSLSGDIRAAGFGVLSAVCFAGYVIVSRVLRAESLATSLFYTAVGALTPMLLLASPGRMSPTLADLLPALALGALSLLILGSIDLSLDRAPLSTVAPWLAAVPALEVVAGATLGHSVPGKRALVGCGLIVGAVALWMARIEGFFPFRRPLPELRGSV